VKAGDAQSHPVGKMGSEIQITLSDYQETGNVQQQEEV